MAEQASPRGGAVVDLSLIPTPELFRALADRYDGFVAMGYLEETHTEDGASIYYWWAKGKTVVCRGICATLQHELDAHGETELTEPEWT